MAFRAMPREELTVDELKVRISSADVPHRSQLCLRLAEKQLAETGRLYSATENERAQTALTDVVAFSELARDYAIQSHKNQKQTEIAVRVMTRKLTDILHTLAHGDQGAVREALHRLDRVRDDLLVSMFPKGSK
jgi:hypothetical protein